MRLRRRTAVGTWKADTAWNWIYIGQVRSGYYGTHAEDRFGSGHIQRLDLACA